jgi:carbon monoxide dehydrogenase subunit G
MDMKGEYRISAPRQKVWDALNDPEILKQCIAGCEELSKDSDTEFTARVHSRIGPVSAKFTGKVQLSEIDAPNGYRISGEGQGGVAGFAKGGATVKLTDDGNDTVLVYEANATVGGKLAQIGSRLIDATARKMADEFFGKFADAVGGPAEDPAAADAPAGESAAQETPPAAPETSAAEPQATPSAPTGSAAPAPASGGLSPAVWVGGLVAVAVIVLIIVLS